MWEKQENIPLWQPISKSNRLFQAEQNRLEIVIKVFQSSIFLFSSFQFSKFFFLIFIFSLIHFLFSSFVFFLIDVYEGPGEGYCRAEEGDKGKYFRFSSRDIDFDIDQTWNLPNRGCLNHVWTNCPTCRVATMPCLPRRRKWWTWSGRWQSSREHISHQTNDNKTRLPHQKHFQDETDWNCPH